MIQTRPKAAEWVVKAAQHILQQRHPVPEMSASAEEAFRSLRALERANMKQYGYELFEDPTSGALWLAKVRELAFMQDPGAGWLWDHPVGDPFEDADIRVLDRLQLYFGRPLGSIEAEDWITVKGGAGSGNFGHSGRPGKRGGSAGRASAPSASRAEARSEEWILGARNSCELWQVPAGARLPERALGQPGLLLLRKDGSAVAALGPKAMMTHAELAHKVGMPTQEFDRTARLLFTNDKFVIHSSQVGIDQSKYNTNAERDRAVETRLVGAARQLRKLGYPGSTELLWLPWAQVGSTRLEYALEDWKSYVRITLAMLLEKGGAGSGNFGHSGRPGRRGGSAGKNGRGAPSAQRKPKTVAEQIRRPGFTPTRYSTDPSWPRGVPYTTENVQRVAQARIKRTLGAIMSGDEEMLGDIQQTSTLKLREWMDYHGGIPPTRVRHLTDAQFEPLWDDVAKWPDSSGKRIARNALRDIEPRGRGKQVDASGLILRQAGGVVGVASIKPGRGGTHHLLLNNLGVKENGKGYGERLMRAAFDVAKEQGTTLRAEATFGSRGFYEAMGMSLKKGTSNIYEADFGR